MLKKIWFVSFVSIVFGLAFPSKGLAQKLWTLDDCIAYALKHSLNKKTQDINLEISKERWRQSKRNMLPSINVSYPSYNVSYGRTLDPVTNSFVENKFVSGISGGLSTSLTVFQAFRKWHQLTYQKIIYESNKFEAQQMQYNLAFKIMDLYNMVLYHQGALTLVKEQQEVNKIQEKTILKKVELGLKAKADLYEIEATVQADALTVLKAENNLKQAKLALTQEMNLNSEDIEIASPLDEASQENETLGIDTIFETSQKVLPQLLKSKLQVATAKKQLQINKTALYPSIYLGGGISTRFSENFRGIDGETIPFSDQLKNNQSKYFGISLSYPIFGNGRVRSQIKIAKKQLQVAENNYSIEKQLVYKTIQELIQKHKALKEEIKLNQATLKAKTKVYEIAQKKYEKHIISLYELQIASSSYLNAKIDQVRLSLQKTIQQRTLDFYNGTYILPKPSLN